MRTENNQKRARLRELIAQPLICDPPSPDWLECRRLMAELGIEIEFERRRVPLYGGAADHG